MVKSYQRWFQDRTKGTILNIFNIYLNVNLPFVPEHPSLLGKTPVVILQVKPQMLGLLGQVLRSFTKRKKKSMYKNSSYKTGYSETNPSISA